VVHLKSSLAYTGISLERLATLRESRTLWQDHRV
jgi:hypothetical protein